MKYLSRENAVKLEEISLKVLSIRLVALYYRSKNLTP